MSCPTCKLLRPCIISLTLIENSLGLKNQNGYGMCLMSTGRKDGFDETRAHLFICSSNNISPICQVKKEPLHSIIYLVVQTVRIFWDRVISRCVHTIQPCAAKKIKKKIEKLRQSTSESYGSIAQSNSSCCKTSPYIRQFMYTWHASIHVSVHQSAGISPSVHEAIRVSIEY